MFIIFLKLSANRAAAADHMEGHNNWLKQGFADEVFILAGSLQQQSGGGILAHNTSLTELQTRIDQDPFVQHDIVTPEIIEITPALSDPRLDFLTNQTAAA